MACSWLRFYSGSLFVILILIFLMKEGNGQSNDQRSDEISKSALNGWRGRSVRRSPVGGMWFGPRLGKRSHAGYDMKTGEDGYLNLDSSLFDTDDLDNNAVLEFVDTPTRIAFPGGKRRFTPRLGRELQLGSDEEESVPKAKPRSVNFIPRLGRELVNMENADREYSDEVMNRLHRVLSLSPFTSSLVADRANDVHLVENPGRPPFAPRLGRKMPPWWEYTPRPGRDLLNDIDDILTSQKNRVTRSAKKSTEHRSTR